MKIRPAWCIGFILACLGSARADSLSVWSHFIGADAGWLRAQAQTFSARTGQQVSVHNVSFTAAVTSFMGDERPSGVPAPDVFVGVPHDYLALSVWRGVVAAPGPFKLTATDDDAPTLETMKIGGKLYGLPLTAEAVALAYNRQLVRDAPRTWPALMDAARVNSWGGRSGLAWDTRNPYMNYGLISAYGGYVFGKGKSGPDVQDVGLASAGAVKAAVLINDLIYQDGVMHAAVDEGEAKRLFLTGKAAMFLAGPWDMGDLVQAGMDFGLAPLPRPPGAAREWSPFVSVSGVYVSADSTQKTVAAQFARQLTGQEAQVALAKAGGRIPASRRARAELRNNPIVSGFGQVIGQGTPLPHIVNPDALWQPWGEAMAATVAVPRPDYSKILSRAVDQMKSAFKP